MDTIDKIILGTVQMGLPYGIRGGGNLDFNQSSSILKTAYRSGIRSLDTAEVYGRAHQVIGNFHTNSDMRFEVTTKLPKNVRKIVSKVEQYLEELQVEKLENLMFHSFEDFLASHEIIEEFQHSNNARLVKEIGVSIYTNEQLEEVIESEKINLIQLPFNLLDNFSMRGELLKKAKENKKTIHTRSVFLQGLFFMDIGSGHKVVKELKPQLMQLQSIAKKENRDMASLALNYALQQELVDKVLIGVDSIDQLKQNIEIAGNPLSQDSLEEINNILIKDKKLLNPSLWN